MNDSLEGAFLAGELSLTVPKFSHGSTRLRGIESGWCHVYDWHLAVEWRTRYRMFQTMFFRVTDQLRSAPPTAPRRRWM